MAKIVAIKRSREETGGNSAGHSISDVPTVIGSVYVRKLQARKL
jgi:hypothetical protein